MWSLSTCIDLRVASAALLLLLVGSATAGRLESLVSPGPLSQPHAHLEGDCSACHARFEKTRQDSLCLECHQPVAADLRARSGYHGRIPDGVGGDCRQCHAEHKGRGFDLLGLNPAAFDHRRTDFELAGAHASLACGRCHAPAAAHRDAPVACVDCHRTQDPHRGGFGQQCDDCHDEREWTRAAFDHDQTDFPLTGEHADTPCAACHPDQRFRDTPTACVACHALNDVHGGRNGDRCKDCHDTERWADSRFDHGKETDFTLRGMHARIPCRSCHTTTLEDPPLKTACASCHAEDDRHKGRNGEACGDCHGEERWLRVRFDHDSDTDFVLEGAHRGIACAACHRGGLQQELQSACVTCHRADDPHQGQQGTECAHCHDQNAWSGRVLFDHGLTRFPLVGLHAAAPCEECHLSAAYRDTPGECVECHRNDDQHEGALGDRCETCHNPNGWMLWSFDHDRQTDFPLDGSHAGLQCAACHRARVATADTPTACQACHRKDDVHHGAFGASCERCHGTETFRELRLNR